MDSPFAQLKLEALLAEVRVDYEQLDPVVNAQVEVLKNVVLQIPEKKVPTSLVKGFLSDLDIPQNKVLLEFKRPECFTLVGSYSTRTMARPVTVVDLAIRIPKACFYEKDFLNHRYHAKRALYLAFVCKYLRRCDSFDSIEWGFFHEDARKPILIVHPASGALGAFGSFHIRILTTISTEVFDLSKLTSDRNNVRHAQNEEGLPQATPNYNASILEDMSVEERSCLEKDLLSQSKTWQEAVLLLKVWLRQRSCYDKADTMNGFLLSMLILHLSSAAAEQRVTRHMTALQIFRVTLELIATQDVLGKGIRLQLEGKAKLPPLKINGTEILFLDRGGLTNMSFRLTRSALAEVKHAADRTLAAIKISGDDNGFQESFLTTVDFAVNFDYQISILNKDPCHPPLFHNDGIWRQREAKIEDVLSSSLKERTSLVRVVRRAFVAGWDPDKSVFEFLDSKVNVGMLLSDFDTAFRMVDVGPSADNKEESVKFRSFWGKKAELRRFRDGTISETVAWECEQWKRHLIIPQITKYVLGRHLSVPDGNIEAVSDQLDFAIYENKKDPVVSTPRILKALEEFTKRLKSLNLPLKISTVQPLSAAFRHAAVFPPRPLSSKLAGGCLEPLDVMIQLEGSGRWPSDPIAIQKTKVAFCLKIADSAQKLWKLDSVVSEEAVDVLMDGFAFRLHVHYEKDPTLSQKDGASPAIRSMHSSMLSGFNGRFPAYGPTVRLAKRWIAAHLFSDVLTEESTELLVAYTFNRPHPLASTCNRVNGFLRFLRLLANFDWKFSPLIVDLNGDLSVKDRENVVSFFEATRKGQHSELYGGSSDGPAMFVATAHDTQSLNWTNVTPSKPTLKRLVAYAKSSAALLSSNMNGVDARWQSIFRTPLTCYTAVMQLQKKNLPYPGRVLFPAEVDRPAVVTCRVSERLLLPNRLVIGFNPVVEFVNELKEKFGDLFDVWYDSLGGDIVGLTSKSEASGLKRKRDSGLESVMKQIADLGSGLVHKIYLI